MPRARCRRLALRLTETTPDRPARLALADAAADALLCQAISQSDAAVGEVAVRSVPVPAHEERPPMIVHILPICRAAHDVFAGATTIVVVTPVVPLEVPTATVIQGLFDLTPAEARIAELIGGGSQPRDVAAQLGVAEETARTTLKRVFAKTGVGRQADLVALLNGAAVPFHR